jgi:DNA (cytosine-5)-methyltransferase 1
VPQHRERIFIVASIEGREFNLPLKTHGDEDGLQPFRTSWDAIGDLDLEYWPAELQPKGKWAGLLSSIPEGQNYLWHSSRGGGQPLFGWRTRYWSFLLKLAKSRPSWTLQAHPGPATGPFHWRNRMLSIEELCRLQTFPKGYLIRGSYSSARRQVGNAVPCAIGELLGLQIRRQLLDQPIQVKASLIAPHRRDCPPPETVKAVPRRYLRLRGSHQDHPGVGLGPGASSDKSIKFNLKHSRR